METKPKVTAKDFFLWLGGMVALYVASISFIMLIHQYINVIFVDPALEPYGGFYSGPIRFAIASLIVFFPLYVWLTRMIHQDIREVPEKKMLWVGRWLTYLTLFVAGLAMAIDLVTVINTFLNGDLTTRFFLKALSVVVVVGAVFWYYLHELKGTWQQKEKLSKTVGAVVSAVIFVSIVAAFFVVGSPGEERLYRIDDQRISDLSVIQSQITSYYQIKQKLPETLGEVEDPLTGFNLPYDPETGEPYAYSKTDELSFELCATFSTESREIRGSTRPSYPYGESWEHNEGKTCFIRNIDPDRFPPLKPAI